MSKIEDKTISIAKEYAALTNNAGWINSMCISDYLMLRNQAISEIEKNIEPFETNYLRNNPTHNETVNTITENKTINPIKKTVNKTKIEPTQKVNSIQKNIDENEEVEEEKLDAMAILAALEDD